MEEAQPPLQPLATGADTRDVKLPLPLPSRVADESRPVRVTIGGSSRDWWRALHRCRDEGSMPASLEPLASGTEGEVALSQDEWAAVHRWASALPGWIEGDGAEQLIGEDASV